ncbi:hypothetical protein PC129_g16292 [Phytophthora cactorum]|uniref:HTH CENPB-type domain-containing protein n=2 Tax=Phytophthora cactorum TaxID=29920 RepID=A0A329RGJ7_9STRA|nr:hypothetical protein PC117_g9118 [Phytophthora cactorum]KAG2992226.1 hypothetical protein PC119_g18715 [Phytophthora cactorum]KAG3067100.1 hypothetical protein PC122_g17489 [Phytophthora cactorum]KAG3132666.1 hypothetical protein C6341_g22817 [Phytophthora cactorum]KAG3212758.1 hypothetical protein PC129_g16292 [Phytophthora cactorum]
MARTGRLRKAGSSVTKLKQYKWVAKDYAYKLRVLEYLDTSTMPASMAECFRSSNFNSKQREVNAWKKLRAVIEAKVAGGSRYHQRCRTLGMGATLPVELEEQLVRWINELRADGVPVTSMMPKQAQELYRTSGPCIGLFKASWSWQKPLLRHH